MWVDDIRYTPSAVAARRVRANVLTFGIIVTVLLGRLPDSRSRLGPRSGSCCTRSNLILAHMLQDSCTIHATTTYLDLRTSFHIYDQDNSENWMPSHLNLQRLIYRLWNGGAPLQDLFSA